jgi:hypothetical protein
MDEALAMEKEFAYTIVLMMVVVEEVEVGQ